MEPARNRERRGGRAGALLLVLVAGQASACSLFFKAPRVEVVGVELVSLGLRSGTAEVELEVTNRSSRGMSVHGLQYRIEVKEPGAEGAWALLAEGFHADQVELPGRQVRRVKVPVPFQYEALGAALRSFLARGEIPYRVTGEVRVGGSGMRLQIPLRSTGVLRP
jgi:LEA14-like dessication related protein